MQGLSLISSHPLEQIRNVRLLPESRSPSPAGPPCLRGFFVGVRWGHPRRGARQPVPRCRRTHRLGSMARADGRPRRPTQPVAPPSSARCPSSGGQGGGEMSDLFELSVPRWELVPRGSGVCFVLLVLVRLSGRRTVGEFMPFDLIVVVLPSETVSDSLVGEETSPPGGLIVAAVPIALDWFIAFAMARCRRPNRIVEGHPGLVARA